MAEFNRTLTHTDPEFGLFKKIIADSYQQMQKDLGNVDVVKMNKQLLVQR